MGVSLTKEQRQAAAQALVDRFAPAAPASIKLVARELLADRLEADPSIRGVAFADERVDYRTTENALTRSGAAAILAPWRVVRALKVEAT